MLLAASSSNVLYDTIHESVFTPTTPTVAPKDLPMSLDQQSKLLPGVEQFKADVISEWSVTQVADFIGSLPGCAELSKAFIEEVSYCEDKKDASVLLRGC